MERKVHGVKQFAGNLQIVHGVAEHAGIELSLNWPRRMARVLVAQQTYTLPEGPRTRGWVQFPRSPLALTSFTLGGFIESISNPSGQRNPCAFSSLTP